MGTRKDGVYRWERPASATGRTRRPDPPTQRLIAELLGIPQEAADPQMWPRWLSLDPLQQPTRYTWDAAGATAALAEVSRGETAMNRRHVTQLIGTTLTTSLWMWLTADPVAAGQMTCGRRLGEAAVGHVEERVRQLRHADDIDGGGQLLTETTAALAFVVGLLKTRSYSDAHGARLHAAAADLARMHAWAQFDAYDQCADAVFHAALRAAHASGDPVLGSHILAFWSIAAGATGRPDAAEDMIATALTAARGRSTPRVEAMLHSRRARARARRGDQAAFTDLGRAAELLHASEHETPKNPDPEWVYWFDAAELAGVTGSTHLDFDQSGRAEQAYIEAAALFPADRVRTRVLFLGRQADAQWLQGDADRACATAHHALDLAEEINSPRAASPLRDLADQMSTISTAAVQDFRERLASLPA
ncbi:XRE family transcriptional regulator [Streptomyces sp. RFCAC02]|uniref:XRE family transcriptional regulator n=1 Tax=Streptomyces sp. RFCAC02 TaxID=2499143 RepID=UPI001F10D596|nr:XRE family transcriptional regulator [Streptomyces sp. RFCAC02]